MTSSQNTSSDQAAEIFSAPAAADRLPEIAAYIEGRLESAGCPMDVQPRMMVAADEVCNNIVSYSGSADIEVVVERGHTPESIRLTFRDSGRPWNPLAHDDPDTAAALDERTIGGYGILIVKKLMDDVSYEHRDGKNVLSMLKLLSGGAGV